MDAARQTSSREAFRQLRENLAVVESRIQESCDRAGRRRSTVSLIPIVKYVGPEIVRLLHEAGIRNVGESTVQGTLQKRCALEDLEDLRWHLVGHLQRNKARRAVQLYDSLHSLDSERLARKLDEELRSAENGEIPGSLTAIYIEVNISGESTKWGLSRGDVEDYLGKLQQYPQVASRLAGLMTMAPYGSDPESARPHFQRLRELRDHLVREGLLPAESGLSMGMSGDYTVAVEEGASVVRVGSRIFEGLKNPAGLSGPSEER